MCHQWLAGIVTYMSCARHNISLYLEPQGHICQFTFKRVNVLYSYFIISRKIRIIRVFYYWTYEFSDWLRSRWTVSPTRARRLLEIHYWSSWLYPLLLPHSFFFLTAFVEWIWVSGFIVVSSWSCSGKHRRRLRGAVGAIAPTAPRGGQGVSPQRPRRVRGPGRNRASIVGTYEGVRDADVSVDSQGTRNSWLSRGPR